MGYLPINVSPVQSPEMQEAPTPSDYAEPGEDEDDQQEDGSMPATRALLNELRGKCHPNHKAANAANKKLWQDHMRKRQGSVRMYQSRASKVINDARVKALRRLSSAHTAGKGGFGRAATEGGSQREPIHQKSLLDVIFDPKDFGSTLASQIDPITRTVLQAAGADVFDEIGRADDPWKMPAHAVKEFIARRENKISGVGETIHDQLKTQLTEAADKGDTMGQIADRVRSVFTNCGKYEAKRIAMTETCAAYGYARHQAMTDAGVEFKSWLSSHGPNVRAAHADAEADYQDNPIPVDEPFEVDGEQLMYPGDDSGSPGNVINCQCIQIAVANPNDEGDDE